MKAGRLAGPRARRLAALVATASLGPSCGPRQVTLDLGVPNGIAQNVAWFEIGAYPNAVCPSSIELAGGIPLDGATAELAFQATTASPPAFGSLPRGSYAFAATARASDCSIVATGCENVDVSSSSTVAIQLSATAGAPAGACEAGSVCQDARCVPASDNSSANVGAGCSLELVGAGPLGDPIGAAGGGTTSLLSSPVIVATSAGFLIAYREFDPSSSSARLTLIPIDNGGGSGTLQTSTLPGCADIADPDATGLAFNGDTGLVALARPACAAAGGMIGIDFVSVNPAGNVSAAGFKAVAGASVSLATARALAVNANGFLLAMTIDGQTYEAPVSGVDLAANPAAFGNTPPQVAGWVAGSSGGTALVALGTGQGAPTDAGPTDAGAGSSLRVNMAAPGDDLSMLPAATQFPAHWGSVSMVGTRALVASDGPTSGQPVAWHAFDVGNATASASGGFAIAALGEAVFADVVLNQDHAFFAVEVSGMVGTIALVALDHVSTAPAYLREVPFSSLSRIPLGDVRDGLVSVAASDTRVAVAWGTGKNIGINDSVGGYAVFACTP